MRYDIFVVSAHGGEPRQLTHDRNMMSGLAWLPDSTGVVYGSSRGITVPYLPPLRLVGSAAGWAGSSRRSRRRRCRTNSRTSTTRGSWLRRGCGCGSTSGGFRSVVTPRTTSAGRQPITRQTGQVLTPTAAPDGDQIAFLSDSGGHANLWVMSTRTGELRQITFEDDPAVAVGVPVWSPDGDVDRVCLVEGPHRFRLRRVGRQSRRQQPAESREAGPRHGLVARRQMAVLRRHVRASV